jgi:hypothetical protein
MTSLWIFYEIIIIIILFLCDLCVSVVKYGF